MGDLGTRKSVALNGLKIFGQLLFRCFLFIAFFNKPTNRKERSTADIISFGFGTVSEYPDTKPNEESHDCETHDDKASNINRAKGRRHGQGG